GWQADGKVILDYKGRDVSSDIFRDGIHGFELRNGNFSLSTSQPNLLDNCIVKNFTGVHVSSVAGRKVTINNCVILNTTISNGGTQGTILTNTILQSSRTGLFLDNAANTNNYISFDSE